jgi:TonB family protein
MLCHTDTADVPEVTHHFAFHMQRPGAAANQADPGIAAAGNPVSASNAVVANSAHQVDLPESLTQPSSPLAAALPFELGKPLDATAIARLGVTPNSPRAQMLKEWGQKLITDPDIKAFLLAKPDDLVAARKTAFLRAVDMMDGMQRISQQDRERLSEMSTLAFTNAPADCGGTRNIQQITSRYLSLEAESDDEFQGQLQAIFDLLKQSTQTTPPPQVTAAQRLQGQLALAASIAEALKADPSETDDLALLTSGKQADLSPTAWCKAMRFYREAFDRTPEPARDWVMLSQIEDQKRVVAMLATMIKNMSSSPQVSSQSTVVKPIFEYAEAVRQRVRPFLVWTGKPVHGETVVEVHCTSSGNLESVKIVSSSGNADWDSAAVRAVRQADPMPLDQNGEAPRSFKITLRPGI